MFSRVERRMGSGTDSATDEGCGFGQGTCIGLGVFTYKMRGLGR